MVLALPETDAGPSDLEAAVAPEDATETARQEIKNPERERVQAKAKAPAQAATDALPTEEAGGPVVAAGTKSETKPEIEPETEPDTEPETKPGAISSNRASLNAASMLAQICERAFMEHQLAARHFTFLSFWGFFVPLNFIIAATSILAFIAGDSNISDDSNAFNILVGCIAAFGVFWNSCDRMLSYKSRADMHTGAKMVCKELLADLDFAVIKFKSLSEAERNDPKHDPMSQTALNDIKTKIDQVQESCTSSVPDAINQAFKEMNSLVVFDLGLKGMDKGCREHVQILRIANVFLRKEITKSPMWPMKLPVDGICKKARDELAKEVKIEDTDLGQIIKANLKPSSCRTAALDATPLQV